MDRIILRGLPVSCIVGTLPAERTSPQTLFFDLDLYGDFSRAGETDDLGDAVDYTAVERCVKMFVSGTSFFLLERLAYASARVLLDRFPPLRRITLTVRKPSASVWSESVALEITLERS